tara:strand:- start:531 stop:1100 length:570 start_codon:yes stop_codon:yes gene_type:complete
VPAKKSGKSGLSRRYAQALFQSASEDKVLDKVEADVNALVEAFENSSELRLAASNPVYAKADIIKAFAEVANLLKVQKTTSSFIELLAENRRLALIPYIAEEFYKQLAEARGEVKAYVTSAVALNATHKTNIQKALSQAAGKSVQLEVKVNKAILGGLKIQLGSELLDASVQGKLERLTRQQKIATLKK